MNDIITFSQKRLFQKEQVEGNLKPHLILQDTKKEQSLVLCGGVFSLMGSEWSACHRVLFVVFLVR